jgi:hypothetical protein
MVQNLKLLGSNFIKHSDGRNLRMFIIRYNVCLRPFQPSLLFASKTRAYVSDTLVWAPGRNTQTELERLAREKHYYESFDTIGPFV